MSFKINSPFEFYELTKAEQRQLLEWCGNLEKTKGINQSEDSYSIKHLFEKSENGFYIPNGAMKGAILSSGFQFSCDAGNVNYKFNVSQRSIDRIRK